jgi:membrane protease subunit (stomatin/prohibitin family)
MNDREKLIELIMSSGQVSGFAGSLATYLIANGVVIQKQGEWVKPTQYSQEICINCGLTPKTFFSNLPPYCPNCGAKMK